MQRNHNRNQLDNLYWPWQHWPPSNPLLHTILYCIQFCLGCRDLQQQHHPTATVPRWPQAYYGYRHRFQEKGKERALWILRKSQGWQSHLQKLYSHQTGYTETPACNSRSPGPLLEVDLTLNSRYNMLHYTKSVSGRDTKPNFWGRGCKNIDSMRS